MASTKMTKAQAVTTSKAPTVKAGKPRATAADKDAARLKAVAGAPRKTGSRYASYLKELALVVRGHSELTANPKDRRFADEAGCSHAEYRRLQVYLATQRELGQTIDESDLDLLEKGRARFFASLVTDALAPSNRLPGNPVAVCKIVDTKGENLVKGWKHLVHDVRHNHMLPSQVDATHFKVGENLATSCGQVVLHHELFELLQFTPTTAHVHLRPLVMSPPQVNKYYAVDLTPDKSLIKWATNSGIQLFVISWRKPTVELRHWGLDHYVMAIDAAVDAARASPIPSRRRPLGTGRRSGPSGPIQRAWTAAGGRTGAAGSRRAPAIWSPRPRSWVRTNTSRWALPPVPMSWSADPQRVTKPKEPPS